MKNIPDKLQQQIKVLVQSCTAKNVACLVVAIPDFEVGGDDDIEPNVFSNSKRVDKDMMLLSIAVDTIKNHYALDTEKIISAFRFFLENYQQD